MELCNTCLFNAIYGLNYFTVKCITFIHNQKNQYRRFLFGGKKKYPQSGSDSFVIALGMPAVSVSEISLSMFYIR